MSTVIALHWSRTGLDGVVVRTHVTRPELAEAFSLPIETGSTPADIGRPLAAQLASHATGRAKIVVAVGRAALTWQHVSVPPCPADDLVDMVRLQASQDAPIADNEIGFDFLPLAGDHLSPHRVWGVSIRPAELEYIQKVCAAADLKLDHIVPLSTGYPAWVAQGLARHQAPLQICVAPTGDEATLWVSAGDRIVLFRQLQLPTATDLDTLAQAIAGELQRTRLVLSQQEPASQTAPASETGAVQLVGHPQHDLSQTAEALRTLTGDPVELAQPPDGISLDGKHSPVALPLAGLALQAAHGRPPHVDLLHPRRRAPPPNRRNTYAAVAAIAAALAAVMAWTGYAALTAPLAAADSADAEFSQLETSLAAYAVAERQALSISNWQANSANLLTVIDALSATLRPEPLTAKPFPLDQDTVLVDLALLDKRLTLTGAVRDVSQVPPLENKLRQVVNGLRREDSSPNAEIPDYAWRYKFVVDVGNLSPPEVASP